jgi:transposase
MALKLSKFESEVNLLLEAKTTTSIIATTLKKSLKSIKNTQQRIKRKKENSFNLERARKGPISKITPRTKRVINRDLTRSPKKENKRLLLENNLPIKKRALQRLLKEEGYSINTSSKKPIINKENAKKRLIYAKEQDKNIKKINLNKIIFSDESAIQRGHGSRTEYYRKRGNNKVGKELVSTKNRSKFFKLFFLQNYREKGLFFF